MIAAATGPWVCPFCNRHVPGHIDTCHCGHERPSPQAHKAAARRVSIRRVSITFVVAAALGITVSYYGARELSTAVPPLPGARARDTSRPIVRASSNDPDAAMPPSDDTIQRALRGIVSVETPESRGTGFFSAPDLVTTTRHILGTRTSALITTRDGRRLDATMVSSASEQDVALLRVAASPPSEFGLLFGRSKDVRNGQAAVRLTWPDLVARGVVRGVRTDNRIELIETDLPTAAGDEGSPLIERGGRVIGIVTTRHTGSPASGFAVTMDGAQPYVRQLPESPAIRP